MARPASSLDETRLRQTLIAMLDSVMPACAHIEYRLVGTGAALLHGVHLPAGDVDILVRERHAVDAFASALAGFICLESPAWLPHSQQYYVNFDVGGVEVGISTVEVDSATDTIETFGPGPWQHFALLPCGRHTVPTVALELRLITELHRNRADRYEPLIRFLQANGCNIDLIGRGIGAIGLPRPMQDELLRSLSRGPANRPA